MISYVLESTLVLVIFYLYYQYLLRNETCHEFKRFYLLITSLLAATLPLLHLEIGGSTPLQGITIPEINIDQSMISSAIPVLLAVFYTVSCDSDVDVAELKTLNEDIHTLADVIPEPKDGIQGLYSYVASNLKYPKQARELGVEGKVYVQFVVTKEGKVRDVSVKEGIGVGCDKESVRVIESYQNWKPGIKDGQPVNVQMVLPITFRIDENTPTD